MKPSKTRPANLVPRLRAAGIPMPGNEEQEEEDAQPALRIELSRPGITKAYDTRAGSEYVFGIRITNHSYAPVQVERFKVDMEWRSNLILLSDPRLQRPDTLVYRMESGRRFPWADVVNYRVRERGTLDPGQEWEGVLLATDYQTRVPCYYLHGTSVAARIRAIDWYGREHTSYIEVSVDRTATMPLLHMTRPRRELFDRETNVATDAQLELERTSEMSQLSNSVDYSLLGKAGTSPQLSSRAHKLNLLRRRSKFSSIDGKRSSKSGQC